MLLITWHPFFLDREQSFFSFYSVAEMMMEFLYSSACFRHNLCSPRRNKIVGLILGKLFFYRSRQFILFCRLTGSNPNVQQCLKGQYQVLTGSNLHLKNIHASLSKQSHVLWALAIMAFGRRKTFMYFFTEFQII